MRRYGQKVRPPDVRRRSATGEGMDGYAFAFGLMGISIALAGFNIICYRAPGMRWGTAAVDHAAAHVGRRDDHGPGRGQRRAADPRPAADQGRPPCPWLAAASVALLLGLAAVALQIDELLTLPFQPGQSGFASVFTGFYPVALVMWLAAMVWLEILIMRARAIPAISFVEQPPAYAEAFAAQRFQAALSAFTVVWNYLAVVTVIFWLLFYIH
jgi:hypothetical protein